MRAGNVAFNDLSNVTRQEKVAFAELSCWVAKDRPTAIQLQVAIQAVKDHFCNPEWPKATVTNQG